ncbi:hypothetical protein [Bifidobacterium gallicum]|uniref:Uncharacterized protein n=1 Tax=Bifidobacterium gallicum DSM 20093 = LMG 11596 TaxID=561180 RepID=D1NWI4_9BIFI|nr:hypothetical protein [Bifidobacterium gallicum]EFA22470.1 hypothetical protein BIFGAL_04237 [Bifidobacterium gallicum DSM 20093 = LMG 11596]KFI58985.1 hypothetical protein BGLCM_0566 [Bifidobacterium gallicum DSM 20093 = LMG 11596]
MIDEKQLADSRDENPVEDEAGFLPPRQKHTWRTVVAVVAVILTIVAASFGVVSWKTAQNYKRDIYDTAYNTCVAQSNKAPMHEQELQTALQSAQQAADRLGASDVADPNTLNDLQDAINDAQAIKSTPDCEASMSSDALFQTAKLIDLSIENSHNATKALEYSTKAAIASQKELQALQR